MKHCEEAGRQLLQGAQRTALEDYYYYIILSNYYIREGGARKNEWKRRPTAPYA